MVNTKKTKRYKKQIPTSRFILITAVFLTLVGLLFWLFSGSDNSHTLVSDNKPRPQMSGSSEVANLAVADMYPTDEADSLWAVVNKGRSLPTGYAPADLTNPDIPLTGSATSDNMKLRRDAAGALAEMSKAANVNGIGIRLTSGYRSYATQASVYAQNAATQGQAEADKTSAHPGHSEHQTGLAVDVEPLTGQCSLSQCFATTPEGVWLSQHAHEYGFIVRYQDDKVTQTGYSYEPWHLRFVGKDLAAQLYQSKKTMEEHFGLDYHTTYPKTTVQLR